MSEEKCCATCEYYTPPDGGGFCGECHFPVPAWVRTGATGGGFVSNPEFEGVDCMTYRPKEESPKSDHGA